MVLPVLEKVALIVGITAIIIVLVIAVRVATGRKWRNRIPFIDKPESQAVRAAASSSKLA